MLTASPFRTRGGLLFHLQVHGTMRPASLLFSASFALLLRRTRWEFFHSSCSRSMQFMSFIVSSSGLHKLQKRFLEVPITREARMDDILAIMGPFDKLYPYSYLGGFYVRLVRECIKINDFVRGICLHVQVIKSGFVSDIMLGNVIMDLYVKNEALGDAQQLFDEMPLRDLVSWCTLIAGYAKVGTGLGGLDLFRQMWRCGPRPNQFLYASVLKAAASCGDVEVGRQVHSQIVEMGFVSDGFLVIGLIDMYAKCGDVLCSRDLFDGISARNSTSWNAMLSGYIQNGLIDESMLLYGEMRKSGSVVDVVTIRIILCSCVPIHHNDLFKDIHAYTVKIGLNLDEVVSVELLRLHAKNGDIMAVRNLLKTIKNPDGAAFSAISSGILVQGHGAELLDIVKELLEGGLKMNQGALIGMFGICFMPQEGAQLHACTLKFGYLSDISTGNALISTYARCGKMEDAKAVFHGMDKRDLVSWTAIASGHVQNLQYGESITIFNSYRKMGLPVDQFLTTTVINASAGLVEVDLGKQMHAIVLKLGLQHSTFLQTSILHMYVVCGFMRTAAMLFSSMLPHDTVSTNVMLVGYCRHRQVYRALELFSLQHHKGFAPDHFTIAAILFACLTLKSTTMSERIHAFIIKSGLTSDLIIATSLINLYIKCEQITIACKYLEDLKLQDVGFFLMVISSYVQCGSKGALRLFYAMHCGGLHADHCLVISILRGCAALGASSQGRQVHASIVKRGLSVVVDIDNTLVDMYAKSFCMDDAEILFDEMSIRDEVSCNAMIRGYSQAGEGYKAFELFKMMKHEAVFLDGFTYVGVLSACTCVYSLKHGSSVHACAVLYGFEQDVSFGNTLVNMYAKCGSLKDAWKVFENMPTRNLISWNAMVSGYAQHGYANEALELFQKMKLEGMTPDHITYISVLSACSRVGLVDVGISYFASMNDDHGVVALEEHYACMVDILSRAGWLYEAHGFLNQMPVRPSGVMWRTLLAACRNHGNLELGIKAAHQLLLRETRQSASYVLLSNIYAMSEKWIDVKIPRDYMKIKGVKKQPGCSWIEMNDGMDAFWGLGNRRSKALAMMQ